MATTAPDAERHLPVELYDAGCQAAVLDLINADRLAGQPPATPARLAEALAGRSPVDSDWWKALSRPRTEVARTADGTVAGVISYATRPADDTGLILWLHCREQRPVAALLIAHALSALAGCGQVHAFAFASALGLGLEALPVRHRPITHQALVTAGFTGEDRWRYLHTPLPLPGLPHVAHYTVRPCDDPPGRRLEVHDADRVVAEAVVTAPVDGVGILRWIGVAPDARRLGLGRALLGSALDLLCGLGAREAILYVDDDAPPGHPDRDRTAANDLYDRAGLREVDRLFSYAHRRAG